MSESERICPWALRSSVERHYHDTEWGRPQHDESRLFELLILEGAQAGLSWRTILQKRERYREQFDDFSAEKMSRYTPEKIEAVMADSGVVRNRAKIMSAVTNARAYIQFREAGSTLDDWLWGWVDGEPTINRWHKPAEVPARTELSDRISSELKHLGFKFVGSTIVYAFMQAVGLVNDHLLYCPNRHTGCRQKHHADGDPGVIL